jgi:hypothetical protein
MSNQGRALLSSLNAGDFAAVDQYSDLSDLDIKIVNSHVHELFERSIRMENFKLFRALLKIPKILVSGPEYCALRHAASVGLVEYVSELVRIPSVNPNLQGKNGETALLVALKGKWTQKKALDLVRAILLTGPVKTNIKDEVGRTALFHAMAKGWYEVADALLAAGAHPKTEDEEGQTPLFLALTGNGVPGDLFQKMLSFTDDAPEEEAEEMPLHSSAFDDDATSTPQPDPFALPRNPQHPHNRTPGTSVSAPIPDDDDAPPIIKKVETVVQDFVVDEPPLSISPKNIAPDLEDNDDFFAVMEGQAIDDTLEKSFLFSPSKNQRLRIHRKAVLENIVEIATQLSMTGEAIVPSDCAKKDPATGLNLWQTAAVQGQFLHLLKAMARFKRWPEAADLMGKTVDGRSLVDYLEENAQLSAVVNDTVWMERPKLLAALMASLPERRLRSLAPLVAKTNLLILNGGR